MSEEDLKVLNAIHGLVFDKQLPTHVDAENIVKTSGLSADETQIALKSEFIANCPGIEIHYGNDRVTDIGLSTDFQ